MTKAGDFEGLVDAYLKAERKFTAEHKTDTCNQEFCIFEKVRDDTKQAVLDAYADLESRYAKLVADFRVHQIGENLD